MMIRHLAATAAAVLSLSALVPVSAATAADSTLTGVLSGASGPQEDLAIGWVEADDFSNTETVRSSEDGSYSLDIPDDIGEYLLFTNLTVQPNGVGEVVNPGYAGEFFGSDGRAGGGPSGPGSPSGGPAGGDWPGGDGGAGGTGATAASSITCTDRDPASSRAPW